MDERESFALKNVKCPICNYESIIEINSNNICMKCPECLIDFCALCGSFPFHYDKTCSGNDIKLPVSNPTKLEDKKIEKLYLDTLSIENEEFIHPFINSETLSDLVSISISYCESNLILINKNELKSELKRQIFDKMNVYICHNHRKPLMFILGHNSDVDVDINEICPVCNSNQFPVCPEHNIEFMSYKCCSCCSTATHIDVDGKKIRFICDHCIQTRSLNSLFMNSDHFEKKCRFYPFENNVSEIVGRCNKCNRLFLL